MNLRRAVQQAETWNKKLHIYLGLYFVVFLWLFAVSGLFMNHPKWFVPSATRSYSERTVELPRDASDLDKARRVLRQLGLSGEVLLTTTEPRSNHFSFRAVQPHRIIFVWVELATSRASVRLREPVWSEAATLAAVMEELHTFTGIRPMYNEPGAARDWLMSRVWSFSIDALSVGLVFMVCSGWYMWYQRPQTRRWGFVALLVGVASCSFLLWGFDWIR